jgi:RimJ/RimL family protein N-acetyltransferase
MKRNLKKYNEILKNKILLIEHLKIRYATLEDTEQLFKWANDPIVRLNAINQHQISLNEHLAWFNAQLDSKNSFIYIFSFINMDCGLVRFNLEDNAAKISYLVDKDFRGLGLGKILLQMSMKRLTSDVSQVKTFVAEVKENNIASHKVFLGLNFKKTSQYEINREKLLQYKYHLS